MPSHAPRHTVLSTKGQVILPKAVRDRLHWQPGTQLILEDTEDGVLLRAVPALPRTEFSEVFGCLKYTGAPKSLEDMNAAVLHEAARRHARD